MTRSERAPCITLTTDFGTRDGYVGAMKGVLIARAPGVPLCDITHDIPRHDTAAAAFALAQAAPLFPDGTVHVAVVDPGVGGARREVVVAGDRHVFVGPDNGLLSLVAPAPRAAFAIESPAFRREEVSATFHGRDVFAPAAAALAAGARPDEAGPKVELMGGLEGGAMGGIIHVDQFGNLITAIPGEAVPSGASVRVGGQSLPIVTTYSDVAEGEPLAYVGSAGTIEIAVRRGSAADLFSAGRGSPVAIVSP